MGEAEKITPQELMRLAQRLAPSKLVEVADFIEWLQAKQDRELPPLLRDAPFDDEPTTAENLEAIAEAIADTSPISAEEMKQRCGLA